jgi:recombination protein RecR
MNKTFDYLIDALKSLPGVGTKQAKTIAQHLIKKDDIYVNELIVRIKNAKDNIKFCSQCNNICENELCDICRDFGRDVTKLCIVTTNEDLTKINETKEYNGLYFVTNDEYDGKKAKELPAKTVTKFIKLLNLYKFHEIIIATN